MKKVLALSLSLLMVLVMFAGCGSNTSWDPEGDVIKIGVFEPATGDNGAGGKQEVLGIEYAHDLQPTVTIDGKEYEVELVNVDNESANDKAITAAKQLVSEGVSLVLGSYGSGVSIAAAPTFVKAGIPAIGISCTNQQVTSDYEVYSRICFLDPFQGEMLANYAYEEGMRSAYCLSKLGDDYSANLVQCFITAFEALGGEIVGEEQFSDKSSDFTSFITNAKNNGADVFFSPVSNEAAKLIIDQANSNQLGMPILAGDTWDMNVVAAAAKGTNLDITCSTFYAKDLNDVTAKFDSDMIAWINEDSTRKTNNGDEKGKDTQIAAVSALGYDAYNVAIEAIKKANSGDPAAILEALPSVTYSGVTGDVAFNSTGDVDKNAVTFKKVNTSTGEWKFFKQVTK